MEEPLDTPEEFFIVQHAKSFAYALRGMWLLMKTIPNAWVHVIVFSIAFASLALPRGLKKNSSSGEDREMKSWGQ